MYQAAIMGAVWGLAAWAFYAGFLFVWSPKWLKSLILSNRFLILMCDLIATVLGSKMIMQFSGTITAGIGTIVLMLACLFTSSILLMIRRAINMYRSISGGRYAKNY